MIVAASARVQDRGHADDFHEHHTCKAGGRARGIMSALSLPTASSRGLPQMFWTQANNLDAQPLTPVQATATSADHRCVVRVRASLMLILDFLGHHSGQLSITRVIECELALEHASSGPGKSPKQS